MPIDEAIRDSNLKTAFAKLVQIQEADSRVWPNRMKKCEPTWILAVNLAASGTALGEMWTAEAAAGQKGSEGLSRPRSGDWGL